MRWLPDWAKISKRKVLAIEIKNIETRMHIVYTNVMRRIRWSSEKNKLLIEKSGGSARFEDIAAAIDTDGLLDDIEHPNVADYPHQRMFVVAFRDYVYAVPYVEDDDGIFLKTFYPSRRLKALYWPGDDNDG